MYTYLYSYGLPPGFRDVVTLWRPEYASYMVEGTPGKPYGHLMAHFNLVECNMKQRYCQSSPVVGYCQL